MLRLSWDLAIEASIRIRSPRAEAPSSIADKILPTLPG